MLDIWHKKLDTRVGSQATERLKTSRVAEQIRKIGNIRKMLNMDGDAAHCLVFLPEIKLWQ